MNILAPVWQKSRMEIEMREANEDLGMRTVSLLTRSNLATSDFRY